MLASPTAEDAEFDLVFDERLEPFARGIAPSDSTSGYFVGGGGVEFALVRSLKCALRVWLL